MRRLEKNVMLNLVQHLTKSRTYETLKQVQGDKIVITTQSLKGEEIFLENWMPRSSAAGYFTKGGWSGLTLGYSIQKAV
jgi:hypothetical protein